MSTESTATVGPAEKASRWADNEKIALLVAVNKSMGGKIIWSNVEVPAGRTTGSSQKQYEAIVKQASGVTMTGGKEITPASKKRKAMDSDDIDADATPIKAKKPRAPRKKKAEPKAAKGGKTSPPKSATTTVTAADDEEEEIKDEDGSVVKEEECEGLIGDPIAALGDGEEVAA